MVIFKTSAMDTLDAITTRFSVRSFTPEPLTDAELATLLNAGFCAPTASNTRSWEFVVVRERDALDRIADFCTYQKMLYQAPLAIVVCANEERMPEHDFQITDASAATENILLAANAIGLGGCWCGILDREMFDFFSETLGLPATVHPIMVVALGHPAEHREQPERFDATHVHYERFGEIKD